VCVSCKHVDTRGNRWDGDRRLVCLAADPVVSHAGAWSYVTGQIEGRVEMPRDCVDLNSDGQCEAFEADPRRLTAAPDPTRPSGRDGGKIGSGCRDCHAGEVPARWPLVAVIVLSVAVILYGIGFAVELARNHDSQGQRDAP